MRKVYIPTTSLNFNNIFSTESLSPPSFYNKRGFGYKRFDKIPPNPFDDFIVGYGKFPVFSIIESDYESYPLVVEYTIEDSNIINKKVIHKRDDIEVFLFDSTIYFNPNNVKVYFYDKHSLKSCLIKSEPSIETKLVGNYKSCFIVGKNENNFDWRKEIIESIKNNKHDSFESYISFDQKINRVKGFYYSFLSGLLLSSSRRHEVSRLKQSFHHILSALENTNDLNFSIPEALKNNWQSLVNETNQLLESTAFKIEDISIANFKLTAFNDKTFQGSGSSVYQNISNMLLDFPITSNEDFKASKADIAFEIGKILKENIGTWEGSNEQNYINGLLAYLESYQPFDIKSHKSQLLQSISAFVIKGDDPEKLLQYLEENKIYNKRIALGLWGCLFGFASFPKTLYSLLFRKENKAFGIDAYCYLYNQLFNERIDRFEIVDEVKTVIQPKNMDKLPIQVEVKPTNTQNPLCPKCGKEMVLRPHKKGDFYGCSDYSKGCTGKRDLNRNELDDNFKVFGSSFPNENNFIEIILDYLKDNSPCKIADLNSFMSSNSSWSYNVSTAKDYLSQNLFDKIEFVKVNKTGEVAKKGAEGIKLRSGELFS